MQKQLTIASYEEYVDLYEVTDGTNTVTFDGTVALVIFGDLVEFDAESPHEMVGKTFTITH